MKRKLIVNADDFGMSEEVNQAIVLAHRVGLVSSASAMVNGLAIDDLRGLRERQPRLGVGLHLSITEGRPISTDLPTLTRDDGSFWGAFELLHRHDQVDRAELERELRAQLQRFVEFYGALPDHLDVHQYSLAFFPTGLSLYLQLAREHSLPVRTFADFTDERRLGALVRRVERQQGIRLPVDPPSLASALQQVAAGYPTPRTTDGWFDAFSGETTVEQVLQFLREFSGDSLEWMCHPAMSADLRRRECELLTAAELIEPVSRDWELTTFAGL